MCTRKNELIEKLGIHIEQSEQIAPVAARIIATLILTGKKGITFEELVTNLCASKSTVFTHLTHLQSIKRINYFTKPGDRKKYFVITTTGIIQKMNEMMENWKKEKELHLEIMQYKIESNVHSESENDAEDTFDLEFHKDYLSFLEQANESILKLKQKLDYTV